MLVLGGSFKYDSDLNQQQIEGKTWGEADSPIVRLRRF